MVPCGFASRNVPFGIVHHPCARWVLLKGSCGFSLYNDPISTALHPWVSYPFDVSHNAGVGVGGICRQGRYGTPGGNEISTVGRWRSAKLYSGGYQLVGRVAWVMELTILKGSSCVENQRQQVPFGRSFPHVCSRGSHRH